MTKLMRPPKTGDVTAYMRLLLLRTERELIGEIERKRRRGFVDYAEVASLERIQSILQNMVDESWSYVPEMIETIFYRSEKDAAGYRNARVLTATQTAVVQQLGNNLLGQLTEASETAYKTVERLYTIGRLEADPLREMALKQVMAQEASGRGWHITSERLVQDMQNQGITAFVDKAGRKWSLQSYGNMVVRTTARQAEVATMLTADDYDLWQIVKIGSTCPVCAALEGRVYSKSGQNPDYPPLSLAFGKVDPQGSDDLTNTYLNIHPNCLVPGGFILAEGVMAASRRDYKGNVIQFITSRGNKITVTPNHPVLTNKGFVPAGLLKEGDKIVETTSKYVSFFRKTPNDVNIPTRIEEIFHSFVKAGNSFTFRVKGSPIQFHGDGIANSKVDIIFPTRLGINERDFLKKEPIRKEFFPSTHCGRIPFFSKGAEAQVFVRPFFSFYSFMSRFSFVSCIKAVAINGKEFSDLGHRASTSIRNLTISHSLIMEVEKFREQLLVGFNKCGRNIIKFFSSSFGRKRDTIVNLSMFKGLDRGIESTRDLSARNPLLIKRLKQLFCDDCFVISELTHKSTSFYEGYVYNLETKYGYYVYNNIVTHNCLHSLIKYTTIGKTDKQIQRDKDFSNPEKNPLDRDPRTKKQIAAYREKERARQKLLRDMRQHKEYRAALGSEIPKDFAKFQEMKYNNIEKWNSIKLSFRRKNNLNTDFSALQEPLKLRHVKTVLSEMGIDYGKTKIKIIRDPDLIGRGFFGWTNPNGKEVQLYPDCFHSREELVKTLGHERIHLEQLKLWGPAKTNEEAVYYERGPRISEEYWWSEYRRKTNYDGKKSD